MAKDRNGFLPDKPGDPESPTGGDRSRRSKHRKVESDVSRSSEEDERTRSKRKHSRRRSRRRDDSSSSEYSESESSGSESDISRSPEEDVSSESEDEKRRRRRKEKRRREREREYEKERRRRKEKKRRRREKEEREERKKKRKEEHKKKKKKEKVGAVTNSWGKYGIIRETDMWDKRPEFTAWLAEVKQVNLEHLSNWEEKLMFKEFMEDHNTATFQSKKYYNLDAYHQRKMAKEMKRGLKKVQGTERTVFNDEEQRRQELLIERERHKEEKVEALKCVMQSGMAQAMKEQAQLREEMAYQYRLGNFEAAAAIQKRLDPDAAL